ncbi:phage holin family protein [Akkermansiaceae bacterium]|nr:phage holin family protein [Akkermansiaceae bacterium]
MPLPYSNSSANGSPKSGLKTAIASFAKSASGYAQARAELLAIESAEAAIVIRKRLVKGVIAAVFLGLAYLLLLVVTITIGGHFLSLQSEGLLANWTGIALILGALHLLIGLIFLSRARSASKKPLFEFTRSEWVKDQQWIQENTKKGN